eukprot:883332-Pyramimonas_sp.AAC.1
MPTHRDNETARQRRESRAIVDGVPTLRPACEPFVDPTAGFVTGPGRTLRSVSKARSRALTGEWCVVCWCWCGVGAQPWGKHIPLAVVSLI